MISAMSALIMSYEVVFSSESQVTIFLLAVIEFVARQQIGSGGIASNRGSHCHHIILLDRGGFEVSRPGCNVLKRRRESHAIVYSRMCISVSPHLIEPRQPDLRSLFYGRVVFRLKLSSALHTAYCKP